MALNNTTAASVTIKDFQEASRYIEETLRNGDRKQDLLQLLERMDHARNTREFLFYYQQFVDLLNHHIVGEVPVLAFLTQFFPK